MGYDPCCTIALVGQPNCGKSTLFNALAGYKAISGNFPGVTVKYEESKLNILGETARLVDLPGIYSLSSRDPAELETRKYLLSGKVDVIINIIDASILGRSLELTLELLELEIPMVIALNMMDVAEKRGEKIDVEKLSRTLGVPVYPLIAKKGKGLKDLIYGAVNCARGKARCTGKKPSYEKPITTAIQRIIPVLEREKDKVPPNFPYRFIAIKILEEDEDISRYLLRFSPQNREEILHIKRELEEEMGEPSYEIINKARHGIALSIFEETVTFQKTPTLIDDKIDAIVMHPILGYVILVLVFYGFFYLIFKGGAPIEEIFTEYLDSLIAMVKSELGNTLGSEILVGFIQGIGGGIAIVIPYLLPFFIGLSFLEDTGYLSRVAFLTDIFMHRIGLHGKSVIAFILGYGCSVPAVLATRNLESTRDRIITSILVTMIPCSARTTVIFGLVGYFAGPVAALSLYALNLLVIGIVGKILVLRYPEITPGMILEIPKYNLPSLKIVWFKTWFRLKEFIYVALPIMMIGSGILSIMEYYHLSSIINTLLSPFTHWLLGLPKEVGVTLIFGIFRKELTLIMLFQALGVKLDQIKNVMTFQQMMVFSTFVMFYIPCLATLAALWKEIGRKGVYMTIMITTIVATTVSLLVKLLTSFV